MTIIARIRDLIRDAAAKGFFHLYVANLLVNLMAFGAQLLVVKILRPEEIGHLKTIQSFIGLAVIIAGMGLSTAVLKLCSEPRAESDKSHLLRRALAISLLPTTLVLIILAVAAQQRWFSPVAQVNDWLPFYALVIPGTVITSIATAFLQANKKIRLMATIQSVSRLAAAMAIIVLTAQFLVAGYISAVVAITTLTTVPLLWFVRAQLSASTRIAIPSNEIWSIASYSLAANLVGALSSYLDILFLNYLSADRETLGYYSVATIFILGLNQITITIQTIATPYFSQYAADGVSFRRVLWRYQKRLLALTVVATLASLLIVPWLVGWFYGDSFAPAGGFFRILALRFLIWSSYALLGVALLGLGYVRYNLYAVIISLATTVPASWILINEHQFIGAAWAQVIGATATLVAVLVLTRHALRQRFGAA